MPRFNAWSGAMSNGELVHSKDDDRGLSLAPLNPPEENQSDLRPESIQPHHVKRGAARGGLVAVTSQAVKFILRIGSMIVLARLLTPNEFGVVAMATVVTGFLNLIKDAGLSAASVQQEVISHEQMSALFWINLAMGGFWTLVTAGLAPVLAGFYQEPQLLWVTLWLAVTFVVTGASAQHQSILQRKMSFGVLAVVEIIALVFSVGVGLAMALLNAGLWALVGMLLVQPVANTIGLWMAAGWVPGPPRSTLGMRPLFNFGGTLTLNALVVYAAYNLDKVLLGKMWGADPLGIYGRAYQLINIPTENLNSSIGGVAFPALARVQNDPVRLRTYFLKGYSIFLSLVMPVTVACALLSEDIVSVFLGSAWKDVVPIFRLLAPTILAFAMINPFAWLMLSTGKTVRSLLIACMIAPIVILGYTIGLQAGPQGVAAGYSVAMVLIIVPMIVWAKHGTLISMSDVALAIVRPLASATIASAATWWLIPHIAEVEPALLRLVIASSVLFSVYLYVLLIVLKEKAVYLSLLRDTGMWPRKGLPEI